MSDSNGLENGTHNGNYSGGNFNGGFSDDNNLSNDNTNNKINRIYQNGQNNNPNGSVNDLRNKATERLPERRLAVPELPEYNSSSPETLKNQGQVVLSGSLSAFSPSSLLSLLNIQKQTGMLHMKSGPELGAIYVDKGEVYDARLDSVSGALALFQLFGWKIGDFMFEVNIALPPKRTIEASLPVLQVRATLWLDNWNKYNPIIPSTLHRIGMAAEPRSEVMIEPYHWSVLTRIVMEPKSINTLANELGQNVMTVTRVAADLVKMGVAVVYPPEGAEK